MTWNRHDQLAYSWGIIITYRTKRARLLVQLVQTFIASIQNRRGYLQLRSLWSLDGRRLAA